MSILAPQERFKEECRLRDEMHAEATEQVAFECSIECPIECCIECCNERSIERSIERPIERPIECSIQVQQLQKQVDAETEQVDGHMPDAHVHEYVATHCWKACCRDGFNRGTTLSGPRLSRPWPSAMGHG